MFDDAGGDPDAAGAAGFGGSVAQVDPSLGRALHEITGAIAGVHEHEVGITPPVSETKPIAGGGSAMMYPAP